MATLDELYDRYYPNWRTPSMWAPEARPSPGAEWDPYNMRWEGGATLNDVMWKAGQAGNVEDYMRAYQIANGVTSYADPYNMTGQQFNEADWSALGYYDRPEYKEYIEGVLKQVSDAAGVPNYDWTNAINTAAMQHGTQFGGRGFQVDSPLPNVVDWIAQNADPQISQYYATVQPQVRDEVQKVYQDIWNLSKDEKKAKFTSSLLKVAGIALGGYFGATAGAGAGAGTTAANVGGVTGAAGELGMGGALAGSAGATSGMGAGLSTVGTAPGLGGASGTGITMGAGGQTGLTLPAATGTSPSALIPATTGQIGGGSLGGGIGFGAGSAATATGLAGAGALAPGFFASETLPAGLPPVGTTPTPGTTAPGPTAPGAPPFDWGKSLEDLIGGLLTRQSQGKARDDFRNLMQMQIDSDLWRGEQPKYFQPLEDTVTKGIGGTAYGDAIANATSRKMGAMGYNMSTNQMHEIGRALDRGTNERIAALTPLAKGHGYAPVNPAWGQGFVEGGLGEGGATGNVIGTIGDIIREWQKNNPTGNTGGSLV